MDPQEQPERHARDTVTAELEAMRQIAQLLESLSDADARRRVIQWAHERYGASGAPQPPVPVSTAPDSFLQVEELGDLFDAAPSPGSTHTEQPHPGVESMIKDFAADFRRLASEWQGT